METKIKASQILHIPPSDLAKYKLHLACWNGYDHPLDLFLNNWEGWLRWNRWRSSKDDFNREYIFCLLRFYHEPNKWLFGGIFRIIKRYDNYAETNIGYDLELDETHKELMGRFMIDFYRPQGMMGRAFKLENYYDAFMVSEVLKKPFDGKVFPGFENIKTDFFELETVFKYQKEDWKTALENVKGVYAIVDKSNGKTYIGAAYGDSGVWARWAAYIASGHGYNDKLVKIIEEKGIDYARKNFRFVLLEYRPMRVDDSVIIARETFWKDALITKEFGYNQN